MNDERRDMNRNRLHSRALYLSYFTVGYNLLEGVLSIVAAGAAGSVALLGFGLDSFVESLSALIMVWRLRGHDTMTGEQAEKSESLAVRLIGLTFFILAAYVIFESLRKLYFREMPGESTLGLVILVLSVIIMPVLYKRKLAVGRALGLKSLIGDAHETLACTYLSLSVLTGLVLNSLWGLWWADPAAGLVVAGFLLHEGREMFGEDDDVTMTDESAGIGMG